MIKPGLKTVNDIYKSFIIETPSDKQLLCFNEQTYTKQQFEQQVDSITKHLIQLGVKQGSVVGYSFPNCTEGFAVFIAIARLGACTLPLFHLIPDMHKAGLFAKANAMLVVTTSALFSGLKEQSLKLQANFKIATLDQCPEADYSFATADISQVSTDGSILNDTDPKLPLLIASSSGTTGIPKLVMMSQGNIASEYYISEELSAPLFNKETNLSAIAFPITTSAIIVCMGTMFAGVTQVFSADVSPVKFLQMISYWKPDFLACPPAYYEALLSIPDSEQFELTSVKRIMVGMDFLTPSLVKRMKDRFVQLEGFSNGYGLIETSNVFMICKLTDEKELLTAPTSRMQVACNAHQIEVRDENGGIVPFGTEGELYVKGPNIVNGYLNNSEENAYSFKDGWFKTGDIVRSETEDCVTLLGRKKYLIKRGGKSISPIVVQNYINQLEGVQNSALVGVPHPLYGEMTWAFIVVEPGSGIEFKDVMKHCRSGLVNYMIPDQILFIDEIPKNAGVGKVNYEKLKELANNELKKIEGGLK